MLSSTTKVMPYHAAIVMKHGPTVGAKVRNGSRVGQVGRVELGGQVRDLDPSLLNSRDGEDTLKKYLR